MRVFIHEFITGGGMAGAPLPSSLAAEGDLMATALVQDFLRVRGVQLIMTRDRRLPALSGVSETLWVDHPAQLEAMWQQGCAAGEAVWPIAPETGGELERLCAYVGRSGKTLLAAGSDAVRLGSSKLRTVHRLAAHGVPVVATYADISELDLAGQRFVIKPDDGVGCEGTRIVAAQDLERAWREAVEHGPAVVQPYVHGAAASLSIWFAEGAVSLLSINRQQVIESAGSFRLTACRVNAFPDDENLYQALSERIGAAVPELRGYAGVDFLITARGPQVLEINPRLTTSYSGLHAATGINVAQLALNAAAGAGAPIVPTKRSPIDVMLEPAHAA